MKFWYHIITFCTIKKGTYTYIHTYIHTYVRTHISIYRVLRIAAVSSISFGILVVSYSASTKKRLRRVVIRTTGICSIKAV